MVVVEVAVVVMVMHMLRQVYVLLHGDRRCSSNWPSYPAKI